MQVIKPLIEREYKAIFEYTGAATLILDSEGFILKINKQGTQYLERAHRDIKKEKINFIEFIHPDEVEKIKLIEEKRNKKLIPNPYSYETKLIINKETIHVFITTGLINSSGNMVVSIINVTDRYAIIEDLQKSYLQTKNLVKDIIDSFSKIVNYKDPYTYKHQKKVAFLCRALAQRKGLPASTCDSLYIIGRLHDIGKIIIPAEILLKTSALNWVEKEIIKSHVEVGYDILKDIEFNMPIAQIIRQHHERYDGTGYPLNLKKDEILPESHIVIIADIVSSMLDYRPYRPNVDFEDVMQYVRDNKGILFDPETTEFLFDVLKDKAILETVLNNEVENWKHL